MTVRSDEHWLSLTDAFYSAATGTTSWDSALEGLAAATGSRTGQLIGVGSNTAIPFNIAPNIDPACAAEFDAIGGGDPQINPRVAAGMSSPVLQVVAESDFITTDAHKRHPHYQDFAVPWDIPFICLTTLERQNGMLIGLSVIRSHRNGHISGEQRKVFAELAPHVRAAVRTQMALDGQGAALVAGAMETLSIPAFVCDGAGRVKALTPAAESLIESGRGLQITLGQLHAAEPADAKALSDAIDAARAGHMPGAPPTLRTVVVHGRQPDVGRLVLDVVALPAQQYSFSFTPRLLIVARGPRGDREGRAAVLKAAYALTSAEADIALQIAEGMAADAIAAGRGVSVGTVRAQIKTILAKFGVNRQIELVARVNQLR